VEPAVLTPTDRHLLLELLAPPTEPGFTCDAIWLADHPGTHTAVLGPGTLAGNNAHADGEFVHTAELAGFARSVCDLLTAFDTDCAGAVPLPRRARDTTRPAH
jgi:hypothetical protein